MVGLLAALAALLLGAVSREELDLAKVELLCASSVLTAFFAAFTLGELRPYLAFPAYSNTQTSRLCPFHALCFRSWESRLEMGVRAEG